MNQIKPHTSYLQHIIPSIWWMLSFNMLQKQFIKMRNCCLENENHCITSYAINGFKGIPVNSIVLPRGSVTTNSTDMFAIEITVWHVRIGPRGWGCWARGTDGHHGRGCYWGGGWVKTWWHHRLRPRGRLWLGHRVLYSIRIKWLGH